MNEVDGATRVRVRAGLVHRSVGDEVFVLMADSTVHWLKNETAVALWDAIVAAGPEGMSLGGLADLLVQGYEVDGERAQGDVAVFVGDLVAKRVLESPSATRDSKGAD